MTRAIFILTLLLAACSGNYKTPGMAQAPAAMSTDTLCFRYAADQKDPALAAEIDRRNLDCTAILREDPLYRGGPDRDTAYKISR